MTVYKIRFTHPAQVERAYEDKRRGGYRVDPIAVGTEMTVNEASLRFWRARGCVEVIERISKAASPRPVKVAEPVSIAEPVANPFAITEPVRKPPTKASLRRAMEDAIQAIHLTLRRTGAPYGIGALKRDAEGLAGTSEGGTDHPHFDQSDCMVLKEALSRVDRDVPGVNPDSLTLIDAAIEDLESGSLAVNVIELTDAIKDVLQQTLPPSRRS